MPNTGTPASKTAPSTLRGARLVDRRRAAGQDDRLRAAGQHLGDRHGVRDDLGVDPGLADPAGDQLGVLRPEVDDEDQVVVGGHRGSRGPFGWVTALVGAPAGSPQSSDWTSGHRPAAHRRANSDISPRPRRNSMRRVSASVTRGLLGTCGNHRPGSRRGDLRTMTTEYAVTTAASVPSPRHQHRARPPPRRPRVRRGAHALERRRRPAARRRGLPRRRRRGQ